MFGCLHQLSCKTWVQILTLKDIEQPVETVLIVAEDFGTCVVVNVAVSFGSFLQFKQLEKKT